MQTKLGIVTQLPLRGLWGDRGPIAASRRRSLSAADAIDLLCEGEVQFVVVDVGLKPRWIPLDDCYRFWMDEVKHRLLEPGAQMAANQMPGVYCYRACEWHSEEVAVPIVVLEICH